MTHKAGWIDERVAHLKDQNHDARYLGFFECFNSGEFYMAHDILEDLWLETRGQPDADFYKALIQIAGGFVHLTMHESAEYPDAGHRLRPSFRLLQKAKGYLQHYPNLHHGLDVSEAITLIDNWCGWLEGSRYEENPLKTNHAPQLVGP